MQSLNLIREFELQRMRDSETIKEYLERLLGIVNRVQFCWEPHSETLELLKRFRFQYQKNMKLQLLHLRIQKIYKKLY